MQTPIIFSLKTHNMNVTGNRLKKSEFLFKPLSTSQL